VQSSQRKGRNKKNGRMSNSKKPRRCERRTSKLLQEGQHRSKKNRSWDMVIERTSHPNPLAICGQSGPVIPSISQPPRGTVAINPGMRRTGLCAEGRRNWNEFLRGRMF
jgi:hypothetical protein